MFEQLFFIIFASVAVVSAIAVVTFRSPVHSALALITCFFQVAGLFVLLRSPFLAAVQVFIYVGAVVVLFLFVVLIIDVKKALTQKAVTKHKDSVKFAVIILAAEMIMIMAGAASFTPKEEALAGAETKIEVLGRVLFTKYLFPFEVVSVLLLVAMVGAIVLTKEQRSDDQ